MVRSLKSSVGLSSSEVTVYFYIRNNLIRRILEWFVVIGITEIFCLVI